MTPSISKVPLPLEIQQTIFYILHNRVDRKTPAAFLRLNREAYNHYRSRFYHTVVLTHTNSATLTKYFFKNRPSHWVAQAVRRFYITSLPNDRDIHHLKSLLTLADDLAASGDDEFGPRAGPFKNLQTLVISHDLILDAFLSSLVHPSAHRWEKIPASPISSLIRKILTPSVTPTALRPPITVCCTHPDAWTPEELDGFLGTSPIALSPYCFSDRYHGYCWTMWTYPQRITTSHTHHGLDFLLKDISGYISGGFHLIQHNAGSLYQPDAIELASASTQLTGQSRSYHKSQKSQEPADASHGPDAEARSQVHRDLLSMDDSDPVTLHSHTQRFVLSNYWVDAPDGWLQSQLEEYGWQRKASSQGGENSGKKGEGIWERRRGDQILEIHREAPRIWCGCKEDPIGGALPPLKGRFGGSC